MPRAKTPTPPEAPVPTPGGDAPTAPPDDIEAPEGLKLSKPVVDPVGDYPERPYEDAKMQEPDSE